MFRVTNRQSRCCSRHGDEIPIEMEIATVSDLHRQTSNGFPFCRQDDRQWPAAKPFVKSTHRMDVLPYGVQYVNDGHP